MPSFGAPTVNVRSHSSASSPMYTKRPPFTYVWKDFVVGDKVVFSPFLPNLLMPVLLLYDERLSTVVNLVLAYATNDSVVNVLFVPVSITFP